ncbi:MAG: hypothetical protein OXI86_20700, partial [Candidatus Poribacteria bacterium]|nr:hypothetical protein [Candidatus Poribacteria bacterium]
MAKLKVAVCAIGIISCTFSSAAIGAFRDIGVGARPLGMGGAFVALADDGSAANYNAAGLGFIDTNYLNATLAQRFKGLVNYQYFGGVLPLGGAGTLGASIGILSEDSEIYTERTFKLSYGKALSRNIAVGLNLKSFGTNFDVTEGFVRELFADNGTSASAFSADAGIIVKPSEGLSFGLSGENLLPADISVFDSTDADSVPVRLRVGLAYSLAGIAESTEQESMRDILRSGLGLAEVEVRNGENFVRAGAEVW